MPEFQLDTSGVVDGHVTRVRTPNGIKHGFFTTWSDLDAFTQGYIEAAFFTSEDELTYDDIAAAPDGVPPGRPATFSDLAPETLAAMIADCEAFQATEAAKAYSEAGAAGKLDRDAPMVFGDHGGRNFWYTRNGHGCGFWDGDWPEPYASELTTAAKAFGEVGLYLGDDGKVYL